MVLQKNLEGSHESLWVATTPTTDYEKPKEAKSYDVVIIGGGIAGLMTAYFLKDTGLTIAVLEAEKIVKGVTGYTTAKLTLAHGLIYDYLIKNFGFDKAKLYAEANQTAIEKVFELAKKYQIECDLIRKDAYTYTLKDDEVSEIKKEVAACEKLGIPAQFVTETTLPFPIIGAVKIANQAQFHPRKFFLGIAKKACQDKIDIFEGARVFKVDDKQMRVETANTCFNAKKIVVTSNFPIFDPAFYYARMYQKRSYVLAVSLKKELPEGMFYSESQPYHSFRTQPYKKGDVLIVGGENHKTGQEKNTEDRYSKLEAYARKTFDVKKIEYRWSTQDNVTIDRVPYIGEISPNNKNVYVATGFGGWGMTTGVVAGMIISDMIQGKKNTWKEVYSPSRFKPVTSAKSLVSQGLNVGKQMTKKLLPEKDELSSVKKGQGDIITVGKKKIAVYRDSNGKVIALSPICTHMGCLVAFNNAEKSWDCPCHGSRFDYNGQVLHGPAVKPLKREKI
jgi:glycine/D-amino acid oxidase-like deaminating enzyme/nitrite reductase/ring-hydroxylating ferredoxin subunit